MDRAQIAAQLEKDVGKVVSTLAPGARGEWPHSAIEMMYVGCKQDKQGTHLFVEHSEEYANGNVVLFGLSPSIAEIDYDADKSRYVIDFDRKFNGSAPSIPHPEEDKLKLWEARKK